jgi:hypothetical protein
VAEQRLDFDAIWSVWVVPLAGQRISGFNGLTNDIVKVDDKGVVRVSRNGLASRIPLEPFRWTIDKVLGGKTVERKEINEEFPHRYSSGILLVLEQVKPFEAFGRPAAIRLRRGCDQAQATLG